MQTPEKSERRRCRSLAALSAQAFPASRFQVLAAEPGLGMLEALCSLKLPDWLKQSGQSIFYLRMFPACKVSKDDCRVERSECRQSPLRTNTTVQFVFDKIVKFCPVVLNHDRGRTYTRILGTLSDLGYGIEWSVLNSKHFGVPQSRKRLFIIGYLDPRCAGEILPVFGTGAKALIPIIRGRQGYNVYSAEGVAQTQTASTGGFGGKTGLYFIENKKQDEVLLIKEATKSGYKEAVVGDSVSLGFRGFGRRGRVGRDIAHTLDCGSTQGIVERGGRIRRLMPRECLRLQGFAEDHIDRLLAITSDSQAYKQAGNCVTVNVIEAIGRKLLAADNKLKEGENIEQ